LVDVLAHNRRTTERARGEEAALGLPLRALPSEEPRRRTSLGPGPRASPGEAGEASPTRESGDPSLD